MEIYLGYFAGFLGTICWIPQARKAWITRDTKGLSLPSNLLFLATVSLWLVYGLLVNDWPLIVSNICAVIIVISIIVAKLRFG
jgi:MtN3 and saliva related transmembrane protein